MQKITVAPFIDTESAARLEAKSYEKAYTDVPNRVLPAQTFKALSAVYFELSGGSTLELEDSTFCVRSENGILRSILAPSVFRAATYDEAGTASPGDSLVIRWGKETFPVTVGQEGFAFPNAKSKKLKLALKVESTGRFEDTCLVATLTDSAAKEIYTVVFPVRSADWENRLDPDVAEVLIEEGNVQALLDYFQVQPDPNRKASEGSGSRLKGHFVKASYFPLGEYTVTEYRTKTGGKFGPDYFIQVEVPEPFVAPVAVKDEATGQWVEQEVEISDWAIMKPNTALKRILAAQPVINPESPARLEVYDHGEYNGKPTAKVRLEVTSFEEKEGEIALNF